MTRASYATLAQVEPELKAINQSATAAEVVAGRSYLTDYALPFITSRIDQLTGQTFMPLFETRPYDATQDNVDKYRNQLLLDMPLLAVDTVTIAGQALTPWTNGIYDNRHLYDYMFIPQGLTPITAFQGLQTFPLWLPPQLWPPFLCNSWDLRSYNNRWQNTGGLVDAIMVTGTWGYRTRYATDAWKQSGDSVQNLGGITDATPDILVNNVNGAQYDGTTPRFSPGQLLLLETEWCEVIAVNAGTQTITAIRGARGSTAAAHVINTTINIYYPEPAIVRAAVRWAAYLYARRAVYEAVTIQMGSAGQYSAVMPMDIPDEARNILHQFTEFERANLMANHTLAQAFQLTRDNLTALTKLALTDMTEVLSYVDIIPNAYPLTQFYFGQGRYARESASTQTWTFAVEMDVTVAEFKQGFDGQAQQTAQFTYLPTLIQYLYEHSTLIYNGVSVPMLDIVNSGIVDAGVQVRNNRLMIVLNWTMIFKTSFQKC